MKPYLLLDHASNSTNTEYDYHKSLLGLPPYASWMYRTCLLFSIKIKRSFQMFSFFCWFGLVKFWFFFSKIDHSE